MGDNLEFAGNDPFINSPKSNLPVGIRSVFEEISQDFGRESLGIFDINHFDFGRESLNFLGGDFGRESLGIINLNSLDTKRESLGITNVKIQDFLVANVNLPQIKETDTENNDRTSPQIALSNLSLNNKESDVLLNNNLPEFFVTKPDNDSNNSVLNTAFLRQPLSSIGSTVSSACPSFNSASLNSSIISQVSSKSTNAGLNEAFGDSSEFLKRLTAKRNLGALSEPHHRIYSLPSTLESREMDRDILLELDKKQLTYSLIERKNYEEENVTDNVSDDDANESVFIEARNLASKIADGSILEPEDNMLDSIREPDDLADISSNEDLGKCDSKQVFKTVDKLFEPSNRSTLSNNSPKDAIEIIHSLSAILSTGIPNDEQKSEGQNLLSSLAEIFLSSVSTKSRSCVLDDSGHSSIESEPRDPPLPSEAPGFYEVLDLSKKNVSETNSSQPEEVCVPLDLSVKSNSASEKLFNSPKILPPRYNRSKQIPLLNASVNHSLGSSLSSNDSRSSCDLSKKFKPRTTEGKTSGLKRGPMKAVLPVDTMAKRNQKESESKSSSFKLKKTSTPISESHMKPMAQSTPDNPRTDYPISPLARPNSSLPCSNKKLKHKINYSRSSLPINKSVDSKLKPNPLAKKGSLEELRKEKSTDKLLVRRYSYSLGQKANKLDSNVKLRKSLPHSKNETTSVLKENRNKSLGRVSVGRKIGKENVA